MQDARHTPLNGNTNMYMYTYTYISTNKGVEICAYIYKETDIDIEM